ncbi:MAG: putative toxin-antitoxin system toxin component, PIN family [Patescibacteria group bacterium]
MKIVLDTNVLVSAIVFGGKPKELIIRAIESGTILYISTFIEDELQRVLKEKFSFSEERLSEAGRFVADTFTKIEPKDVPKIIKRDISDNNILALAKAIQADFIISGDNDLLELVSYQKIPILTPDKFLESRN